MPPNDDINVLVERRLLANIGPTVETVKIFCDHNAVAITVEHLRRLTVFSAQIDHP